MVDSPENQGENNGPVAFVIFGVTGDLTRRKLVPALYELISAGRINHPLHVIGFARRDWDDAKLQEILRASLEEFARSKPLDQEIVNRLVDSACYIQSTFDDPNGYQRLCDLLAQLSIPNCLLYLATPPDEYMEIIKQIGNHRLDHNQQGWTRIVIEKPYGSDFDSANALDRIVHGVFKENQVYRIDHYLGKETVQNILVFRFANGIWEPLWNQKYVDHIQITVAEAEGVGTRGAFYETAGVIRDVFQNHLLQLLALTAMEAPVAFNADAVRDEKVKVLRALRPLTGSEAVKNTYRAQYVSGMLDGKRVAGYKDENNVASSSITETFMAARIYVDNWRWAGIPFYLRSGKRLPERLTEIAIQFKQVPLSLFNWHNMAGDAPNVLVLNLQPDEGITLTFGAKQPGPINQISPVKMSFSYRETFKSEPPEAYERLLLDALQGDATLFTRSDEIYHQWAFTTGILNAWKSQPIKNLPVYEAGTWGPPGAAEVLQNDQRVWHQPGE